MNEESVEVVAVGPHPDDVELGIGGTIAKLSKNGFKTGIIDLTNAEPTPKNEKYRSPDDFDPDYAERRLKEAKEAARILGAERPVHRINSLLYFPVRFIDLHPEGYTSFFTDITNYIDLKQKAILVYKSQGFVPSKTTQISHFPSMLLTWNKTLGSRIGVEYAEHLVSPSPLRCDDFGYFVNK